MIRAFQGIFWIYLCLFCTSLCFANEIPLTLEFAKTYEERTWGLMQRTFLAENHGMLFYSPKGQIWMFNMFMDLSVAFLDETGKIIGIAELKAYPEMMDSRRPVNQLHDLRKYPSSDKVYRFFLDKSYPVPNRAKYALEMNRNWFVTHGVKVGDQVIWHGESTHGYIKTE